MKWITRILAFFGLITLLAITGAVIFFNRNFPIKQEHLVPQELVLTFNLKGDLAEGNTESNLLHMLRPQDFTLHSLIETLDQAAHDPMVKGLLMRLDHADVGIAKIQELQAALKRFRAAGKFTLAHCDTFGEIENGTKGYYLSSSFDEIALQPIGSLNLVGLAAEMPFARKLLDELGIEPRFDRRAEYKSFLEPYTHREMSKENREGLQNLLDNLMAQIIGEISTEREINPQELKQAVNDAPYFNARHAYELGLVDHVFYLDECEKYILQKAGGKAALMELAHYPVKKPASIEKGKPAIAIIFASGPVVRTPVDEEFPFGHQEIISSYTVQTHFEEALEDPDTKAIVLRLNSPGGSPVASESILRLLLKAKAAGIPVVVSMGEYAASGGYWIASGATRIVAQPGTITGSIGVAGGKIVLSRLWDKVGITWGLVKSGENADMNSFNQDFSANQWMKHQQWLDYIYQEFLDRVVKGRNLSIEQVQEIAKGRVWTGQQAYKLGLVDALGGVEKAVQLARVEANIAPEQSVALQQYPRKQTWIQQIKRLYRGDMDMWTALSLPPALQKNFEKLCAALKSLIKNDTLSLPAHTAIH